MASNLRDTYVIGKDNFDNWSEGYNSDGYLKVLPHPEEKILFKDPFKDWQEDRSGNYFSSWGPEKELEATLVVENLEQITIDGFGILQAGDGLIPWLDNKETPYETLRSYNQTIPGPILIAEPGDTLAIELINNLDDPGDLMNLHTHGLHVSPVGNGDNVLIAVGKGETWSVEIEIPDDHFIGSDWYHPHMHGVTNEQVSSGLGGLLIINPPYDLPDIDKYDMKEESIHFLALNSFGIQQQEREGKADDPLNQNLDLGVPAGTPLEVLAEGEDGLNTYELSDSVYMGFNAKPKSYDPELPTGDTQASLSEYGGGVLAEPIENVIHTVNGQYNPTLELETGDWNLFSFANMSSNAFHVVQLVKEVGNTLVPQEVNLVAIDGDASGVVTDTRRQITELPILNPGSRISIQHWFEEPGVYYLLSNGTEEIMGDDAPLLTQEKGFNDGHLIWGSQVLATVEVTGDEIPTGSSPEAYDTVIEQSQNIEELIQAAEEGNFEKERTFVWSANVGGALIEGRTPEDTEVETFEGVYRINGEYFATDGGGMPPLTMPMLGTTEVWNIVNESGKSDPSLPQNIPLTEWHPFHIHQNDFVVLEINGLPVGDIEQNYLEGVLSDTIALPPTYEPGTVTPENPYGIAQVEGIPSEIKILMEFEDYPGSYVNHCHILFHEDAGMMAVVRVILNTEDTWLGLGNQKGDFDGTEIELLKANNFEDSINLKPYGTEFTGGIDLAIADVNYKQEIDNNNVTDNVTDIVSIQSSLNDSQDNFTVKVFDGQTLINEQKEGRQEFDGEEAELLITEFTAFSEIDVSSEQVASVAAGDINGDGYADIVVGIGGGISPLMEIYSGENYELLSRIEPFRGEEFDGDFNLVVGDANGDNFGDIIVGQGQGGKGLVEVYSGLSIYTEGNLDGNETAEKTALLSEPFQPYGDSYQGEIEVTSGYILQRPIEPNEERVQTNSANITTMAVDDLPEGQEQIKVFTYLGGGHGGHGSSGESTDTEEGEHQGNHHSTDTEEGEHQGNHHSTDTEEGEHQGNHHSTDTEGENSHNSEEMRLETAFTPDGDLAEFSGTFADIPDLPRGEPVLFTQTEDGTPGLIRLQENNIPESINIGSNSHPNANPQTVFGTSDDDTLEIEGSQNLVFAGSGEDLIDAYLADGNNRIYGGTNDDIFILGKSDRLVGDEGDDKFFVSTGGNNTMTGGEGADQFWVVTAELTNAANTITDFELEVDVIGIAGYGESPNLSFGEDEGNATLAVDNRIVTTFLDITQAELETATFAFG